MGINLKLIILFIASVCSNTFSQIKTADSFLSARVYYKVEKIWSSSAKDNLNSNTSKTINKTKPIVAILEFDENYSKYYVDLTKTKKIDVYSNRSVFTAGGIYTYYADLKKNEVFFEKVNRLKEREHIYYRTKKWKIFEETKEILNFTCKKAILLDGSKNKTTVWFTTEIPVSYGPKAFTGLKGLILEVNRKDFSYVATKIDKNVNLKIIKPTHDVKIFYEDKLSQFKKTFRGK